LIFAATILIWFAGYWPGDHRRQYELQSRLDSMQEGAAEVDSLSSELQTERAQLLENSLLGRIGHAIEPAVAPLGWDWKIGVGAIASFPAREVIIATLGTIYSLDGEEDEEGLIGAIRASTYPDGTPVYSIPVALSIMVFFALCAQCVSTLFVIQRETNSWLWPGLSFTYMTVLAYLGAMVTYQVGSRFF
jgi:ferrous iron transport protein B